MAMDIYVQIFRLCVCNARVASNLTEMTEVGMLDTLDVFKKGHISCLFSSKLQNHYVEQPECLAPLPIRVTRYIRLRCDTIQRHRHVKYIDTLTKGL